MRVRALSAGLAMRVDAHRTSTPDTLTRECGRRRTALPPLANALSRRRHPRPRPEAGPRGNSASILPRDAEDAIRRRDGYELGGFRIRVEQAKGGFVSTSSRGPPRRGQFRVRVTGLPVSASWQVRPRRFCFRHELCPVAPS